MVQFFADLFQLLNYSTQKKEREQAPSLLAQILDEVVAHIVAAEDLDRESSALQVGKTPSDPALCELNGAALLASDSVTEFVENLNNHHG